MSLFRKKCALLINSCDAYIDILDAFFETLHLYWPSIPYDIYLSTESTDYTNKYFKINNVHPKNKECTWSERIYDAVKNINAEHILFMLDDFFLIDYVEWSNSDKCFEMLKKDKNIAAFIFYPVYAQYKKFIDLDFLEVDKQDSYMVVPAIAGLWNKKQFMKYLSVKCGIWEWEKLSTQNAKNKYIADRFFVTKDIKNNIIPYDFTQYGLFSGKWLPKTKELFKKLNISMDYEKRGFYDEKLIGMQNSIISTFKLDSAIVANYNLSLNNSSYIKHNDITHIEPFHQEYDIQNATDIIRWEPSSQWGFGIKNLKIVVRYLDNEIEQIKEDQLFGSFYKAVDVYVFNSPSPNLYIPTLKGKKLSKLIISGEVVMPLDEELLRKAYLYETRPKNENGEELINKIFREFFTNKEKLSNLKYDPSAKLHLNSSFKGDLNVDIINDDGINFTHQININSEGDSVKYAYCSAFGYSIKDLKVYMQSADEKWEELDVSHINDLPYLVEEQFIILSYH